MPKYLQGKYIIRNKEKYLGDHTNIIYRSSWELKFLAWCDKNPNIIAFSSEEVVIPYKSPVDGRVHRYFVDFYVETIQADGSKKTLLLEVKPKAQTLEPKIPKRRTKRFISEVMTYGVNQAKWKAAEDFCKHKGWEFQIITESELFGKK